MIDTILNSRQTPTNLGDYPLHILLCAWLKRFTPTLIPQQEKLSSQKRGKEMGVCCHVTRGLFGAAGQMFWSSCLCPDGQGEGLQAQVSIWVSSRGKREADLLWKEPQRDYSHDPPTHPHLALRTIFLKLGSFPVTQSPTWNSSVHPRNLQDMAWHSSLHGIWPHRPVHCHLQPCTPPGPQTANSLRIPRSGPLSPPPFSRTAFHPGLWIQKSSICSSTRFSSGLDCSCQLQNSIKHCLLTSSLRCQTHLKLNCLKDPSHLIPLRSLSSPHQ